MPTEVHKLGLVARSRPPATRWGERMLQPFALLMPAPGIEARTCLRHEASIEDWYLGAHDLLLHSGDTSHYLDNLQTTRPSVWVALRLARDASRVAVHLLTVDPYEGEGLAGDPGLLVATVEMPAALKAALADFTTLHHVELPFEKRRRSPATPDQDPRAPRILRPDQKWGPK
ncbi:DUF3305 domain-containing protein [Halodurantibacterium flavum]|uniref:DUF3305 domain-containing protein n=1 Tax=Halodurantibacterium flavum TaxID=1382802 RepID=A0ABW4S9E0_9RHOB